MNSINIGKVIASKRKEKGITQEDLANHIGVTKPAVSKWESGQSYPDIEFLPVLATYFDITVDELIDYEPQMTKEEINTLCRKLREKLSEDTFEAVYCECKEYIRKYFSCWELQLQIGLLLLNHVNLAADPDRSKKIMEDIMKIFERVEAASKNGNLAKQALVSRAICYLCLNQPDSVIEILENLNEPLPMRTEGVLVRAYQMKGDKEKAKKYLQGTTYVNLISILNSAQDYFHIYADSLEKIDLYYQLLSTLGDLFEIEQMQPILLTQLHLSVAMTYAGLGRKENALDALERYVSLLKLNKGNFSFHGNRIFDALEDLFSSIDIDVASPRSKETIQKDLKHAVIDNPVFSELEGEERFKRIKKDLEIL